MRARRARTVARATLRPAALATGAGLIAAAALASASLEPVRQFGVALAVGLALDFAAVRALLVPAVATLRG